jgi:hypothetical protein
MGMRGYTPKQNQSRSRKMYTENKGERSVDVGINNVCGQVAHTP